MPSNRDDLIGLVAVLALAIGTVVLAQMLPAARSAPAPGGTTVPGVATGFDREPTCTEWTDGCVVCQRTSQGLSCSMPGIACVQSAQRCLRRNGV